MNTHLRNEEQQYKTDPVRWIRARVLGKEERVNGEGKGG
jgi:hypothetical protein